MPHGDAFGSMAKALAGRASAPTSSAAPSHPVRVSDLRPTGSKTQNRKHAQPVPSVLACVLQCLTFRGCTATEIAHATDTAYSRVQEALHTLKGWGWVKQLHGQWPRLHNRGRTADQWVLIWPDPFDDEDIEEDDE